MNEEQIKRAKVDIDTLNEMATNDLARLVINSEEGYKSQIRELIDSFLRSGKKIIMLAGPSASGKTTTSNYIRKKLFDEGYTSIVISLDNFIIDRDITPRLPNGNYDYENITSLDLDYYNKFLKDLIDKKSAKMPEYDFIVGKRKSEYINLEVDDKTIIIFEGIHALNPRLISEELSGYVYRIYLGVNTDTLQNGKIVIPAKSLRFMRRTLRDIQTRGISVEESLNRWQDVLDGEEKYIKPFKTTADFFINTMHLNEPLLYANYLLPSLEKTTAKGEFITSIVDGLKLCTKIDKSCVPSSSLLWEFLVG